MLKRRPEIAWKYLAEIGRATQGKTFNRGHEVIAQIEDRFDRVWTLTQNIDGFHRQAGSNNLIEVHGDLHELLCTACEHREKANDFHACASRPAVRNVDRSCGPTWSSLVKCCPRRSCGGSTANWRQASIWSSASARPVFFPTSPSRCSRLDARANPRWKSTPAEAASRNWWISGFRSAAARRWTPSGKGSNDGHEERLLRRKPSMSALANGESPRLQGKRVVLVGKMASMSRRDAAQLLRQHGAVVVDRPDATVHLVVVGEEELPLGDGSNPEKLFDEPTRKAAERGTLEVVTETQLWQRLALVDIEQDVRRLYTPAMLAELLRVPVAIIRRWHRRGLIVPVREVRRLPYFDFQEVAAARRLAELLAAGMSPAAIEQRAGRTGTMVAGRGAAVGPTFGHRRGQVNPAPPRGRPDGSGRPTAIRLRSGRVRRTDRPIGSASHLASPSRFSLAGPAGRRHCPEEMVAWPPSSKRKVSLTPAAEMYRAAMAADGPTAEFCFQVAELLYRRGDWAAARERYYVAIELDEDYVEARANLGCVLAETGQRDLARGRVRGGAGYHATMPTPIITWPARSTSWAGATRPEHWRRFSSLPPTAPGPTRPTCGWMGKKG